MDVSHSQVVDTCNYTLVGGVHCLKAFFTQSNILVHNFSPGHEQWINDGIFLSCPGKGESMVYCKPDQATETVSFFHLTVGYEGIPYATHCVYTIKPNHTCTQTVSMQGKSWALFSEIRFYSTVYLQLSANLSMHDFHYEYNTKLLIHGTVCIKNMCDTLQRTINTSGKQD